MPVTFVTSCAAVDLHVKHLKRISSSNNRRAPRLGQLTGYEANGDADEDDQHAGNHAVPDIRDPVGVEYVLARKKKQQ